MNYKTILNLIGRIVITEGVLFLLPIGIALYYGEFGPLKAFAIAAIVALAIGGVCAAFFRTKDKSIYAGEGFVIVAFAWILLSLIGCLPFYISKEIPNFFDAFFETVSGFTTTGASILTNVEAMSKSLLFWRSFTHWIGGMGVLVFVMAIVPVSSKGSMHIMRAEMPGPIIGKLVPKARKTAVILYLIYVVMTILQIVLLVLGDMPFFESVLHALGTAGTGGFGIKADSIGGYSPYLQWVIAIFMLLYGINFNLYYLILLKRIKAAITSSELWTYLGIVAVVSTIITSNIFSLYKNFADAIRHSFFQVSAIITTTGYSTVDFNLWPELSKALLLILMLVGGCAGSTAGGLKISRAMLLFKLIGREIRKMLHPRSVNKIRFEGKQIEETTLDNVSSYFAIYIVCIIFIFVILSVEPFDLLTNITAAVSCFNNVGPGLARVGPAASYADYSNLSKVILSAAMLLGRLEIFPIIIALSPATWTKKHK